MKFAIIAWPVSRSAFTVVSNLFIDLLLISLEYTLFVYFLTARGIILSIKAAYRGPLEKEVY